MEFLEDHGEGYIYIPLPVEAGSVDFKRYQNILSKIDLQLRTSNIEKHLGQILVEKEVGATKDKKPEDVRFWSRYASYIIRCTIARFLTQESYRSFSVHLADSILLRDFCGYSSPHAPKTTPSKSTLQRFEGMFDTETLQEAIDLLLVAAASEESDLFKAEDGLVRTIDTDYLLLDSTCAKLDIHFPVDWVLLADCVKSIIQSIIEIRKYGIKYRIDDPKTFLSTVNKLCMAMTNSSKGRGDKSEKKTVFRKLKKLLKKVANHGERYLEKLQSDWKDTKLTEPKKAQIEKKLQHTLDLVPDVIDQAHERIIGGRLVSNEKKILSIHEEHAKVYNRGKSGAQVEFGLQLLLGENLDGVITHWDLYDHVPRPDYKHTDDVLARIESMSEEIRPSQLVGDRGFFSASSEAKIEKSNLVSNMCPRDPKQLQKRLSEESFRFLTKRRSQTEARIGILTNNFLGKRIRVSGFENQKRHVAWAVLAHNLWVIARLPYKDLLDQEAA